MKALFQIVIVLLLLASTACSKPLAGTLPLKDVADIPLGGHATRWDYASLSPKDHRLYLAHLGDSTVVVVDTLKQQVIAVIPDIRHVHGVLFVPELNRVYASATGTDQVVVIDPNTFKITARIPTSVFPDGMAYAPEAHKLYVSDEQGETVTVIDTRTNLRVTTIPVGGEVGNTQYDPNSKHIFSNVQSRQQLVEIDPVSDTVVGRSNLSGAKGNHGLLIDPISHLAFIACEDNNTMLVFDLVNRKVISTFEVAKDPDVLAYDAVLGWLYIAGESGEVSLFKVQGRTVQLLVTGYMGPNAHVVAVDPISHQAFFPLKPFLGQSQLHITLPKQ